ncbi:MAG: CopG family antitoxin [Anaerolineae bacterium]
MTGGKSTISKAGSYKAIGEFWDSHDLADYWDEVQPIEAEVEIQDEVTYYPVDLVLSGKIRSAARRRGVPPHTLLNLWLQEKVREDAG